MLREKITSLKKAVLAYADLVEGMLDKSIRGILTTNKNLLEEVIEKDEPKSNDYDGLLDEICTNAIAQFEPKASDLRTILMILKMNNDLERIGDHAVNICESGLSLDEKPPEEIAAMAQKAAKMFKDSIAAFSDKNPALAVKVCRDDSAFDKLGDKILKELFPSTNHIKAVKQSLHFIRIAHNLERIGDLSTNICEDVIFILEGKVIKHHKEQKG